MIHTQRQLFTGAMKEKLPVSEALVRALENVNTLRGRRRSSVGTPVGVLPLFIASVIVKLFVHYTSQIVNAHICINTKICMYIYRERTDAGPPLIHPCNHTGRKCPLCSRSPFVDPLGTWFTHVKARMPRSVRRHNVNVEEAMSSTTRAATPLRDCLPILSPFRRLARV